MSGTKVTTDPAAPIVEKPGLVTSDSLAAESADAGGDFAANTTADVSAQPSKGSNAATTDTSAASELPPADSAAVRGTADAEANRAAESVGQETGVYNTSAGGSSGSQQAPSYATAGQLTDADAKPKGENLKEGGITSDDSKNTSFTTDIGDKNDPGLMAEQKFARENATAGADAGLAKDIGKAGGKGQYDVLKDTSA